MMAERKHAVGGQLEPLRETGLEQLPFWKCCQDYQPVHGDPGMSDARAAHCSLFSDQARLCSAVEERLS